MNILDELVAKGVAGDVIVAVAKLIADAEVTERVRAGARERMRRVRERSRTLRNGSEPPRAYKDLPPKKVQKAAPSVRQRTSRPSDWHPVIAMEDSAEFDRFTDYCKANGKRYADWDAAWRNWRTSPYRKTNGAQGNGRGKETPIEQAKRLADEWTRRERAAGIYRSPDDAGSH